MTPQPHDFRKPAPLAPALEANLTQWFRETCRRGASAWTRECNFALEMKLNGLEVLTAGSAFSQLPESILQVGLFVGPEEVAILVVPRPLLLLLLGGMFRESEESLQSDRDFTPVETSLIPFVVERFFLGALAQSCHLVSPLPLRIQGDIPTKGSAAFTPEALVIAVGFEVQSSWQIFTWSWVFPRKGWLTRLADPTGSSARKQADPGPTDIEPAVRELPLELLVQLGTIDCSLMQLAGLAPGDLFLLEQPVGEPLKAVVENLAMFRVWPGAVGARQAVEIQSFVEP